MTRRNQKDNKKPAKPTILNKGGGRSRTKGGKRHLYRQEALDHLSGLPHRRELRMRNTYYYEDSDD